MVHGDVREIDDLALFTIECQVHSFDNNVSLSYCLAVSCVLFALTRRLRLSVHHVCLELACWGGLGFRQEDVLQRKALFGQECVA